jgi:chromosome segregation ATPase
VTNEHIEDATTLEAIIAELQRRVAPLEAELTAVAAALRSEQVAAGCASTEVFRNMAAARAKPLAEKEQALREQLRILREECARFEQQLASARQQAERARLVGDVVDVVRRQREAGGA